MPKATILQSSFNSGELSPLAQGEVTLPAYKKGLAKAQNYIPTLQGPLVRRPGTRKVAAVKDSANPPVLIPFQFSVTQKYMLEFGDQYIRFYANDAQVVASGTVYSVSGGFYNNQKGSGSALPFSALRPSIAFQAGESGRASLVTPGDILELVSPYAVADVAQIKWVQSADTLYLFHPNYVPMKLQRSGQSYWTLKGMALQDGPYLAANTYAATGDCANIAIKTGLSYNLGPNIIGVSVNIIGAVADPLGSGQIQITTQTAHKMNDGQAVFIISMGGTTEANNADFLGTNAGHPYYWQVQVVSSTELLLVGSTFVHAFVSGGFLMPAIFWQATSLLVGPDLGRAMAFVIAGKRYYGTISSFTSTASVNLYAGSIDQIPADNIAANQTTADAWYLGTFSVGNGYPSCGTFHQDRLWMAGCPAFPQQIAGSVVGDYENFRPSDRATLNPVDGDAVNFTLNSKEVNAVKWMTSNAQGLLAGSLSSEWAITGSAGGEAITPTSIDAKQTSFYGSADADTVEIGNAVLYIQRASRKVRELNYFFQLGTFRSTDLTVLSEHISLPSFTKLAVQRETQPLVWGLRSNGALASMIYDRSETNLQAGWTPHILGGFGDASGNIPQVKSIGVILSTDTTFDQLWMVVQRYINGQTVCFVEYMTKAFDSATAQSDAVHFDCSAVYDSPITVTGISNANPAVVTAPAHGFSTNDEVRFDDVVGIGQSTTDQFENTIVTSLVNGKVFKVGTTTTNTFELLDENGNAVSTVAFGVYVSGGKVRKLVTTISGLTWLENETVGILADGKIHPDVVVSNTGGITLDFPAAKVQIGYRYNSDGKFLRLEAGAADGSSIGKTRRTHRAALMVYRTGELNLGSAFTDLIPVNFENSDNLEDDPLVALFTGIVREGTGAKYDFESQICFRQNSGLPGTIQAVAQFMEEDDV